MVQVRGAQPSGNHFGDPARRLLTEFQRIGGPASFQQRGNASHQRLVISDGGTDSKESLDYDSDADHAAEKEGPHDGAAPEQEVDIFRHNARVLFPSRCGYGYYSVNVPNTQATDSFWKKPQICWVSLAKATFLC